ncbi:MAG: chorismate synthase [Parvibaculales bacterium]
MSHNRFGHLLHVTSWGESHGKAIGCVIDGAPPLIPLEEKDIQHWLDKRKPGQNRFTTQRKESDTVEILSGVFENEKGIQVTTGTPISLLIKNEDARSKDYSEIKKSFRPGHADYSYLQKYGIRDYRGGGRSSARETAVRVAAAAIARKILKGVEIKGALISIGEQSINRENWDWKQIDKNPFWCPDKQAAKQWEAYLDGIRKQGSSIGAVIEVVAKNVPKGLGAPVYGKLDSDLAQAMMSINAVKGVEIGNGFQAAKLSGEQNADEMRNKGGKVSFTSNHSGGIQGGISNGEDIVARFAVKPTSSILTPRKTVDTKGKEQEIRTKGRHDPCVGIRAVPIGEAMMALVLADHWLRHLGQGGKIK